MTLGLQVLNRLKLSPLKIGPYNLICIVVFSCFFSFFFCPFPFLTFLFCRRFLQLVVPFLLDVHVCILAHPLVQGCHSSYLMLLFVLFLNVVACPPACQPIERCCPFSFSLVLLVLL